MVKKIDVYKMDHGNRGILALFDNREFDKWNDRNGQDRDVRNYYNMFEPLGFKIEWHQNKTKDELLEIMSDYTKKDFSNHDCFITVFLTHAANIKNEPAIFATDDFVSLTELTQPIINQNQSLDNKPKIFFIDHLRTILAVKYSDVTEMSLQLNEFKLWYWLIPGSDCVFGYPVLEDHELVLTRKSSVKLPIEISECSQIPKYYVPGPFAPGYSDGLYKFFTKYAENDHLVEILQKEYFIKDCKMENNIRGNIKTNIEKYYKEILKLCYFKNDIELVNSIPERLPTFEGRKKELANIENIINKTGITIINGSQGSGKSALANEFAHQLMEKSNNSLCVRWFRSQKLSEDYISFAKTIILKEKDINDEKNTIERVNNKIIANNRNLKLLFVFDNVDASHNYFINNHFEYLVQINNVNVKVIITTRTHKKFALDITKLFPTIGSISLDLDLTTFDESLLKKSEYYNNECLLSLRPCYFKDNNEIELAHNLPERLSIFFGRCNELENIENNINKTQNTVITGVKGSGKSALANEFAYQLMDKRNNKLCIRWFRSQTKEILIEDYTSFARTIIDEPSLKMIEDDTIKRVNKIIVDKKIKLLLIFDQVMEYDSIEKYIKDLMQIYHVKMIITSRKNVWPDTFSNVALDSFKKYENLNLLLDRFGSSEISIELENNLFGNLSAREKEILNCCRFLDSNLISLKILENIYNGCQNEINNFRTLGFIKFDQYKMAFRIDKRILDAFKNYRQRKFLNNEKSNGLNEVIKEDILINSKLADFYKNHGDEYYYCLSSDYSEAKKFHQNIYALNRSLANKSFETAESLYDLGLICSKLGEENKGERDKPEYKEASKYFLKAYKMRKDLLDKTKGDSELAKYLHHLATCFEKLDNMTNAKKSYLKVYDLEISSFETAKSLHELGNLCFKLRDEQDALKYHLKAYEMIKSLLEKDEDDLTVAEYLGSLGESYELIGKIKEAKECFLEMRKMINRLKEFDCPYELEKFARYSHDLGIINRELGNLDKSRQYLLEAYEIEKSFADKYTATLAEYSSDLAISYQELGLLSEAKEHHLIAYNLRKVSSKTLRSEQDSVLAKYSYNLAGIYENLNDLVNAKILYSESYEMGISSFEAAEFLNRLGLFSSKQGDNDAALKYHLEAYEMRRKLLEDKFGDSKLAEYSENLGKSYENKGEIYNAKQCFLVALKMRKQFSNDHTNDAIIAAYLFDLGIYFGYHKEYLLEAYELRRGLVNRDRWDSVLAKYSYHLAICFQKQDDWNKALDHHLIAYVIMRKRSVNEDKHDSELAKYSYQLAICYQKLDNDKEALSYLIETYKLRSRSRSSLNKDTSYDLELCNYSLRLAGIYEKLNDLENAKKFYFEVYKIRTNSLESAESIRSLGIVCSKLDSQKEANKYLSEAYEMIKRLLDGSDLKLAEYSHDLAISYLQLGDIKRAKHYLLEAIEMRRSLVEKGDSELAKYFYHLAICDQKQNDWNNARESYLKAYEIRKSLLNKDDLTLAEYSYHLAISYKKLGSINQAREFHLIAYEIRKRLHENEDHQEILESKKKLAPLLRRPGTLLTSLNYRWKTFKMKRRVNASS